MKSRHRVKTYGEVFTPRRMVEQMLDLVRGELETEPDFIDKTFLEPAAGGGNFLVAILQRKLRAVGKWFPIEQRPEASLFALASIYGIELLEDNHLDAKEALLTEFLNLQEELEIRSTSGTNLREAAAFLIDTNIVCGNALTGLDCRGAEIQFSWWNRISGAPEMVQREPFTFISLRDAPPFSSTIHGSYQACRIDEVHEEARNDA